MSIIDFAWAIIWFVVGYYVFQVPGIKRKMDNITSAVSIFSLITLVLKPAPLAALFESIFLGYFTNLIPGKIMTFSSNNRMM